MYKTLIEMNVYKTLIEMRRAGLLSQLFIDGGQVRLALPKEPYALRGVSFELARKIAERYRNEKRYC